MVLTEPGLVDTVTAVTVSRRIYQRMMTWTLNKIIKTAQVAVFLTVAFVITRQLRHHPAAHRPAPPGQRLRHHVARRRPRPALPATRAVAGRRARRPPPLALAVVVLVESFLDLWLARGVFHLDWHQTQTLIFLMLVFSGQATVYVVRERDHFWRSRPVRWLVAATAPTSSSSPRWPSAGCS